MSKTVRIPEDLHEELKSRKLPDETMAEVIARLIDRPHPAETRVMLTGAESEAVADELAELYDERESDRLSRARVAFDRDNESDADTDSEGNA